MEASSFNNAFVRALNFIGIGISSSELSLREYRRAFVVDFSGATDFSGAAIGTGAPRFKFGLVAGWRRACLEAGLRLIWPKWLEPNGVGEAVAIAREQMAP